MEKAPCKNCKERKVGCHSICSKYIEWKKEFEKLKAEEKEARSLDWYSKSLMMLTILEAHSGGRNNG